MSEGTDALIAYGYTLDGTDRYVKAGRNTQVWKAVDGGFLRFDPPDMAIPFQVGESGQGRAGLSFSDPAHSEHFDWVWPDAEVARIYAHAAEQAAAGWPDRNEA